MVRCTNTESKRKGGYRANLQPVVKMLTWAKRSMPDTTTRRASFRWGLGRDWRAKFIRSAITCRCSVRRNNGGAPKEFSLRFPLARSGTERSLPLEVAGNL